MARQAEQVLLREQIAAERALVLERRAAAHAAAVAMTQGGLNGRNASLAAQAKANNDATFATQRLAVARERLAVVDAELAVAEGSLAGAQTKAAVSTTAAEIATNRATLASRAGAAAAKLFAGGLTLIGGSVAGGAAVLAIGALVGAIIYANRVMSEAEDRSKSTAAAFRENAEANRVLNQKMAEVAQSASLAANAIHQAGGAAAASTGKVLSFAGAVGEAADKLYALAKARRHEQVLSLTSESARAESEANAAQARITARAQLVASRGSRGVLGQYTEDERRDDVRDRISLREARGRQGAAYRSAQTAANIPLEGRIRESDRVGGRDIDGDLARVTRDLTVARERGIRSQVDALEAEKFELTQYKKYRKAGLSPQAASDAATTDRNAFRGASTGAQGDRDAKTGRAAQSKADREAAAAARKQAAEVRDAAADTRAFAAGERQANNDIAAARADLTNSMVERAAIEKARIEAERQSRNEELAEQAKQGRFGEGDTGQQRLKALQAKNDQRAALET
ncbi:hypothetical protein ACQVP2_35595, partial [Methylobacterium aquaticum]|uniref:hypothetical protein n=1 Tax=Methylobacterium aquaticum TaxID=270351 RepID=UPI003D166852